MSFSLLIGGVFFFVLPNTENRLNVFEMSSLSLWIESVRLHENGESLLNSLFRIALAIKFLCLH